MKSTRLFNTAHIEAWQAYSSVFIHIFLCFRVNLRLVAYSQPVLALVLVLARQKKVVVPVNEITSIIEWIGCPESKSILSLLALNAVHSSPALSIPDDLSDLAQIDIGLAPSRRVQICNQSEVSGITGCGCFIFLLA